MQCSACGVRLAMAGGGTHSRCRFSHSSRRFHVVSFMLLWMAMTTLMSSSVTPSALPLRERALKNICSDGYVHVPSVPPLGMLLTWRLVLSSFVWPGAGSCKAMGGRTGALVIRGGRFNFRIHTTYLVGVLRHVVSRVHFLHVHVVHLSVFGSRLLVVRVHGAGTDVAAHWVSSWLACRCAVVHRALAA